MLRLATVCVLAAFVVRDVLRPGADAVRKSYVDDPDGGVLDGAPDAAWISQRRAGASGQLAGVTTG
jgi:hypothetical protein